MKKVKVPKKLNTAISAMLLKAIKNQDESEVELLKKYEFLRNNGVKTVDATKWVEWPSGRSAKCGYGEIDLTLDWDGFKKKYANRRYLYLKSWLDKAIESLKRGFELKCINVYL